MRSLAALVLAAPLFAATPKNAGTLVVLTGLDAQTLDPASAYGGTDLFVTNNLYECLIGYDGGNLSRFVPLLSAEVPSPEKGRIYRFPIRRGVRFHAGGILSAEDARYSLLRFMLADRSGSPSNLLLEAVTGFSATRDGDGRILDQVVSAAFAAVRVEGENLVVELKAPFAPFLAVAARWTPIIDKEWAVQNGDWDGSERSLKAFNGASVEKFPFHRRSNGTGPFSLERWDAAGGEIRLKRHEGYWGEKAKLESVLIKRVEDQGLRRMMLQNGDADSIFVEHKQLSSVKGLAGVRVIEGLPVLEAGLLFFNHKINAADPRFIGSGRLDGEGIPPNFFSERAVRKAFAHLIDYDGLIRDLYRGSAERMTGFLPSGLLGWTSEKVPYSYDPREAERLLKKAFGGALWEKGFRLSAVYPSALPNEDVILRQLSAALRALNPKFLLEVRGLPWAAVADARRRKSIPLAAGSWRADYADPHNFARPLLHSRGDFAPSFGYGDAEMDALIEQARGETNEEKRADLYLKIRERWAEDLPLVFTFRENWIRVERDWVRGFVHNPIYPGAPAYSPLAPMFKSPK